MAGFTCGLRCAGIRRNKDHVWSKSSLFGKSDLVVLNRNTWTTKDRYAEHTSPVHHSILSEEWTIRSYKIMCLRIEPSTSQAIKIGWYQPDRARDYVKRQVHRRETPSQNSWVATDRLPSANRFHRIFCNDSSWDAALYDWLLPASLLTTCGRNYTHYWIVHWISLLNLFFFYTFHLEWIYMYRVSYHLSYKIY